MWIRIADFIPPNIHQFPPNLLPIDQRTEINHPMATTWTVPLDDTNTMQIGFHRTKAGGPFPMRTKPGFGQDDSRPYEERQRVPGDYDAQVNQRPIAVHDLEHLASTDRGVTMLRNTVRRGIRLVQDGGDVPQPRHRGLSRADLCPRHRPGRAPCPNCHSRQRATARLGPPSGKRVD